MSTTISCPKPMLTGAPAPMPYDEMTAWTELWEACVVVLDRNPHVRQPAPMWAPAHRRVTIPKAAVDAADVHFHLD